MRIYILILMIIMTVTMTGVVPAYTLQQGSENEVLNEAVVDPHEEERAIDEDIFAFRSTRLVGSVVQNLEGENLGFIEDLVLDVEEGCIAFAVLSFGGFLGLGTDYFAIPWEALIPRPIEGVFLLDVDIETLQEAEGFPHDDWPLIGDREWAAGIYEYYGFPPHWAPRPGYWTGPLWDAGGWGFETPYGMLFDPETIETFESVIIRIESFVPMEGMTEGVQLVVEYNEDPLPVHLGPEWFMRHQDVEFHEGEWVRVTGSHAEIDGLAIVLAKEVEMEEYHLQVRTAEGAPLWTALHPDVEEVDIDNNLVEIRDMLFIPEVIEISEGETVVWVNQGPALHTVTSAVNEIDVTGEMFDSPELEPGDDFSHNFEEAGEYMYFCRFHPEMTGHVIVTE